MLGDGLIKHWLTPLNLLLQYAFLLAGLALACNLQADQPLLEVEEVAVVQGEIDLMGWHQQYQPEIKLSGPWGFYWQKLLSPAQWMELPTDFFNMPSTWDISGATGEPFSGQGFATFVMQINNVPQNIDWGLVIPEQSTAFRLYFNHLLIAQGGQVANREEDAIAYSGNQFIDLGRLPPNIKVTFQVSNFHHDSGGPWQALVLAERKSLFEKYYTKSFIVAIIAIMSLVISALLFVSYIVDQDDKATLYLATFSLVMAVRIGIVGNAPLYWLIGDMPWQIHVRLLYLFMLLPMPIIFIWQHYLFPNEVSFQQMRKISLVFAICCAIVLFTPSDFFTVLLVPFQFIILFILVMFVINWLRALSVLREGSIVFLVGVVAFIPAAIHDMLMYSQVIESSFEWVPWGVLFFILTQVGNLLLMRGRYVSKIQKLSAQLLGANKLLEERVEQRTSELASKADALELANEKLNYLANVDGLTGILNRRAFFEQLKVIQQADVRVALCILDIDFFKAVNDNYGHIAGDIVLVELSKLLQSALRGNDRVARLGGEEFAILLYDCDPQGVEAFCQRLLEQVRALRFSQVPDLPGITLSLGGSIGVLKPQADEIMLQEADDALYYVKRNGRDNYHLVITDGTA